MRTRNCQGCGEPLVKPRRNQLYHDDKCKHSAYRAREKIEKPVGETPLSVVLAGIDTLYVSAYYADPDRLTRMIQPLDERLQEHFTELQQQAKCTRQDVETEWTFEEQPLHMLSHGEGKQWHWILTNELLNIQIGNGDYKGVIARIRVSSTYLWRVNALHLVFALVHAFVNRLFKHEMVLVPSSIDLCVDIANWPMSSINQLALIAKARKKELTFAKESLFVSAKETWHGRKLGTLYVGLEGSPVHAKVYDKLKEIKDRGNKKSWFHDLYKCNGWNGVDPVTRLEISLKREALHDLDIETDADLVHNLKGLWAYAVGSENVEPWMRYAVPTDDSNQTRWPLHPLWATVQHAFDTLSEEPARELIRLKKQQVNLETMTASLAGYLSSQTVYRCDRDGVSIKKKDLGTALNDLWDDLDEHFRNKGVRFQDLLEAKQRGATTCEMPKPRKLLSHGSSVIAKRLNPPHYDREVTCLDRKLPVSAISLPMFDKKQSKEI